jgi:hypothetical protein
VSRAIASRLDRCAALSTLKRATEVAGLGAADAGAGNSIMAITAGSTSTSRRHRVEELRGVFLPSVLQHVLRRALLDNRPLVEHGQLLCADAL